MKPSPIEKTDMCAILYVTLTQETGSSFQEMRPGKHFCVHFISDPQDPGVYPTEKEVGRELSMGRAGMADVFGGRDL